MLDSLTAADLKVRAGAGAPDGRLAAVAALSDPWQSGIAQSKSSAKAARTSSAMPAWWS